MYFKSFCYCTLDLALKYYERHYFSKDILEILMLDVKKNNVTCN